MDLQLAVGGNEKREDRKGREFFPVAGGLLVVEVISLASRSYIVSELLVFLALVAACALVGTGVALLAILLHETGRWILRWIKDEGRAKKRETAKPCEIVPFQISSD